MIAITIEARQQTTMIAIVIDQTGGTAEQATGYSSSGSSGVGASIPASSDPAAGAYQSR